MSGDRWFRDRYRDAVWESESLSADQKAIAETYARHARDASGDKNASADESWVTYARLQVKAGVRRRETVSAALDALEAGGWLVPIKKVHRRPTLYRLAIPAERAGSSDVGTTVVPQVDHGSSGGGSDVGTTVVPDPAPVVPTADHGSSDVGIPPLINPPSISSPSASAHRPEIRRIVAATGATDDEAHSVIEKIKNENKIKRPFGVYFSSIPDEHLVDHLAEIRAGAASRRQTVTSEEFHLVRQLAPRCKHHVPGGHLVNPVSGVPTCSGCRTAFLAREGSAA